MRITGFLFAVLITALPLTVRAGLIINTVGDIKGITGVSVSGSFYDVNFVEGSCESVYGVCSVSNFTFTTSSTATNATTALALSLQSIIDDGTAINPTDIFGCEFAEYCDIYTPWQLDIYDAYNGLPRVSAEATLIDINGASQSPYSYGIAQQSDTTNATAGVWAVWASASSDNPTTNVNSPSTLFIFGLVIVGFVIRKFKQTV